MDTRELEQKICVDPWTNNKPEFYQWMSPTVIDAVDLIVIVKQWLALKGVPKQKLDSMTWDLLQKCYSSRPYFDTVIGNRPRKFKSNIDHLITTTILTNTLHGGGGVEPSLATGEFSKKMPIYNFLELEPPAYPSDLKVEPPPDIPVDIFEFNSIKQQLETLKLKLQVTERENMQIINTINEDLKSLSQTISPQLETKILSLVQKSAEEKIFQLLPGKPSGQTPIAEPDELFNPDLPFPRPEHYDLIPNIIPDFYFDPFNSKSIRLALKLHHNLLISGPTGCGKTELISQVHAKLFRPLERINMHGDVTSHTFIGQMEVKNNETIYRYGTLPRAMKNGYTLLVDEIDYTPPHIAAILNPVLEHGGKLYIPDTGEYILPHPGFCIMATANSGGKGDQSGMYTGTEVLNTAFLDRFGLKLTMDYMPENEEKYLINKRLNLAIGQENDQEQKDEIDKIISLAQEIRRGFAQGELSITFSTRKILDMFSYRQEGFTTKESLDLTLLNWFDSDDKSIVEQIMQRLDIPLGEIP